MYKTIYGEDEPENTVTEKEVRTVIEGVIKRANSLRLEMASIDICESKYEKNCYYAETNFMRNSYKSFD